VTDPLFIDTWGWLKLLSSTESRHRGVAAYYYQFRQRGGRAYTTDYVLDETLTLLYKRIGAQRASKAYDSVQAAQETKFLTLEWVDRTRFTEALELRWRYDDKPDISFTDLTSMAVMQELGIADVLTGDAHFEHVGLGLRRVPHRV